MTKSIEKLKFQDLMQYRVHEILLVASPYDAFILEEDGKLTEQILSEYLGMNLSYAPRVWNASSAYKDLIWAVGTAKDTTTGIEEQTIQTLAALDNLLQEQGSHRSQIVSAQVYLTNKANKSAMDRIWCDWVGDDPQQWPQRVCIGVDLHGDMLIEISVTAAKYED